MKVFTAKTLADVESLFARFDKEGLAVVSITIETEPAELNDYIAYRKSYDEHSRWSDVGEHKFKAADDAAAKRIVSLMEQWSTTIRLVRVVGPDLHKIVR